MNENKLTRRSFLRGAAAGGTLVAASGLLGGLTPGSKAKPVFAEDVTWTHEADVVVVGSGTGQLAAIHAAENGLRAIVLEKAQFGGGTTGISGGAIWIPNNFRMQEAGIPDSREAAIEYLNMISFGQSDPALIEAFVDNGNPTVDFLRTVGIDWEITPGFHDYYPEFPGGVPEGRKLSPISTIEGVRSGGALTRMMQQAGEQRGVQYLFETPARQLVITAEGAVAGVAAEANGETIYVRALRGVVVATGGFDHNPDMVNAFLRGPVYYPSAVKTNTGDGHLMGMAVGANLRNMNESWGWPVYFNEDGGFSSPALTIDLGKPGSLVVNKHGVRFFNEAGAYDAATRAFYTYDNGRHEYSNIPAFGIVDSSHRSRYALAGVPAGEEVPAWFKQADTLAELATVLGIPVETFEATVARFNEFAAQGLDPDFNRGLSAFDYLTGGDRTRTDVVNPCLAPLTEAPFYAVLVYPGALGTCGGLQINQNAQVLNVWGEAIAGLYAVGNASGNVMGAGYPGGGGTVGAGLTFAFIAANHMEGSTLS
jgi:succinate dehydrogenase/fumarate reductase flavoprotein subunit